MCYIDGGLWCWDATTHVASEDAPSQRWGWRGVLSFSFEVHVHQGRVTLPCKSLRGVRAPNTNMVLARSLNVLHLIFSPDPSYILYFPVISHSLIQLKQICSCFVLSLRVAFCFVEDPFLWVRDIFKVVFVMPPLKEND